eukprot:4368807-Alexandrium_andersonii.AAC.1
MCIRDRVSPRRLYPFMSAAYYACFESRLLRSGTSLTRCTSASTRSPCSRLARAFVPGPGRIPSAGG